MDIYNEDNYGLDTSNQNGTGFNDTATHDKTKETLLPLSWMYTWHESIEGDDDYDAPLDKENVNFNLRSKRPKFVVWETPFGDDESYIDPLRIIENHSLADKINEAENIAYT